MKPAHVRQWEHAYSHPNYKHLPDHTLQDACDRLKAKWLNDENTQWEIYAHRHKWQGQLWHFNDKSLTFTIGVPDPEDEKRTIHITAPYEQFIQTK